MVSGLVEILCLLTIREIVDLDTPNRRAASENVTHSSDTEHLPQNVAPSYHKINRCATLQFVSECDTI